jgi:hypothetical protein
MMQIDLKNMEKVRYEYESKPSEQPISEKEIKKRIQEIDDIVRRLKDLEL